MSGQGTEGFDPSGTGNTRRARLVALLALVLAIGTATLAGGASAVHDLGLFELDGNTSNDAAAGEDWADVYAGTSSALSSSILTDGAGGASIFDGGGSKDVNDLSQWKWKDANNVSQKTDLLHSGAALYIAANGDPVLYLFADRDATNGDAKVGFWLFRSSVSLNGDGTFNGTHSDGDLLLESDFTQGGANITNINVYKWQGGSLTGPVSTGVDCTTTSSGDTECGTNNHGTYSPPWGTSGDTTPGAFFEAGVNLAGLFGGQDNVPCFSSFLAESRSAGSSVNSILEDFVLGSFSTCGKITIVKDASPEDDTSFGYTTTGSAPLGGAFTLKDPSDNTKVFSDVKKGSYSVTEGALSGGWSLANVTCSATGNGTSAPASSAGPTVNMVLGYGGSVTCTYHNQFQKQDTTSVTQPSQGTITIGGSVSDSITVTGNAVGGAPTGNVHFHVCGPIASGTCDSGGMLVTPDPVALTPGANNTSSATSGSYTPQTAGRYCFRGDYDGSGKYNGSSDHSAGECFTVGQASPAIGTTPSPSSGAVGATLNDSASVTGGSNPTGTVTFNLYAPNAASCTGTPAYTQTVALSGGSAATSPGFVANAEGTWRWTATYSGDANNNTAASGCNDEQVSIAKGTTTSVTTPSKSTINIGEGVTDGIVVTGNATGGSPTGSVHFHVCGPIASGTCDTGGTLLTPDPTALAAGANNTSSATSPAFTPQASGRYCFRGDYDGSAKYTGSSDSAASECFTVASAQLTVVKDFQGAPADAKVTLRIRQNGTTKASGQVGDGGSIGPATLAPGVYTVDEAHVAGSDVDLSLYTSSIACSNGASGTGTALDVTLGDGGDVTCTITNVRKASSITVVKSVSATSNGTYGTSASKPEPGGTFFYKVVVTNTSAADDITVTDLSDIVGGSEVAVSNLICEGATVGNPDGIPFTLAPGASKTCTFTRDVTGQPGTSETDHVEASWTNEEGTSQPDAPSNDATVTITNVPSSIAVVKTANPTSMQEPGGTVTFTVSVRNDSAVDTVMITSLVDSIHGDLNGQGTCLVPQTILPGATYTCTFTATVSKTETDVVTASGVDDDSNPVSANDDATVTITPAPTTPSTPETMDVAVVKDATAQVTLGTDGTATIDYEARVRNNGPNQAHNVMLADPAPSGVVFLSITQQPSQGSCTLGPAMISCNFGTLGPGVQVTVRWNARVNVTGSIRNVATATGQGTDTNGANNTDDAVTLVVAPITPPAPKPKPKPTTKKKPAPVCRTLAVGPKLLRASGKKQKVTIRVVAGKKPVKGVKVRITGPGIKWVAKTNRKGIVRVTLKPKKAGILRFSITNAKACNTQRIGVVGVFEPPVTG